jgi:hypothetical protein
VIDSWPNKQLISIGLSTFIEIKGVTFCANKDASDLTMGKVPFHFEMPKFDSRLVAYLSDRYEVACQHVQSCCILICDKKLSKSTASSTRGSTTSESIRSADSLELFDRDKLILFIFA